MGHTDEEIEVAASRFEKLAYELDPATAEVERNEDLRAIAAVLEALRADEARLREAVNGDGHAANAIQPRAFGACVTPSQ